MNFYSNYKISIEPKDINSCKKHSDIRDLTLCSIDALRAKFLPLKDHLLKRKTLFADLDFEFLERIRHYLD